MRALAAAFLLTLGVAGAQPTPTQEPEPEMVTIPEATLIQLITDYKAQKAANVILWERQQEVLKMLERWHSATNCI